MTEPPGPEAAASFEPGFGQRALLTVDTEEEFDWDQPFSATGHGLDHLTRLPKFQQFCENLGISPVYLVDWPIVTSKVAAEILKEAVANGRAEIGMQLHPWVNPPQEEVVNQRNSFAGNLPSDLERAKFMRLRDTIEETFGTPPQIYRAGRYGLGRNSAGIIQAGGVPIDSSVRAKFDYSAHHGPDYRNHPNTPYWVDREKRLLELPLTSVYWGMLRRQGDWLYPALGGLGQLRGLLSRVGLLERISLTPEGVPLEAAIRGIDIALDDGLPVLVLSFHSPSLVPGKTPYVRTEDDLDRLYDWWRGVYDYFDQRGVRSTTVAEIMQNIAL